MVCDGCYGSTQALRVCVMCALERMAVMVAADTLDSLHSNGRKLQGVTQNFARDVVT